MKKIVFLLFVTCILIGTSAVAQKDFEKTVKNDGLVLTYKWIPSELFQEDNPVALTVEVENTNNYPVKVAFKVEFSWKKELKAKSREVEISLINPNEILVNDVMKKRFSDFTFLNQNLKDKDFSFELVKISVKSLLVNDGGNGNNGNNQQNNDKKKKKK